MNSSQTSKRRLLGVGAVLVALALVAVTWFAATRFQSSAQREASALPPEPQPIMVEVTRTDLVDRTTMKAKALRAGERKFVLPKPGPTSVITGAGVRAGEALTSGATIALINDRPLIALNGSFPLYRDLGPGDTGEDVRMLQRALADLGYDIGADGEFGSVTAWCVGDLFRSRGAEPATRDKKAEAADQRSVDSPQSDQGQQRPRSTSTAKPAQEVYLRSSEVLVIPDLPGHVTSVPPVGTTLGDDNTALVLAASTIELTSEVPGAVAVKLQPGRQATATVGDTSMALTISSIDTKEPATPPAGGGTPDVSAVPAAANPVVSFAPVEGQIPAQWVDNAEILITVDLSDPLTDVLVVPQRAIAADASGAAHLLVEQGKELVQVPVKQISCLTGMCAIEAASATPISEGQRVRVDR